MPNDIAVIVPYFNFANSDQLRKNFLRCREAMTYPVTVVELSLTGQFDSTEPGDLRLVVDIRSTMPQQARLVNLGIRTLPDTVKKVAWVTHDVMFEDKQWLDKLSELLTVHDVGQPYSRVNNVNVYGDNQAAPSWGAALNTFSEVLSTSRGNAWGARLDALPLLPGDPGQIGLLERNLPGNAAVMAMLWAGFGTGEEFGLVSGMSDRYCREWAGRRAPRRTGYLEGTINQLYGSSGEQSQHREQLRYLRTVNYDPYKDLMIDPTTGVFRWASHRDDCLAYFLQGMFQQRIVAPQVRTTKSNAVQVIMSSGDKQSPSIPDLTAESKQPSLWVEVPTCPGAQLPSPSKQSRKAVLPVASVTVVVVSHNYGKYLGEAIESVKSQSLKPAKVIVVDDSSTDNTKQEAEFYNLTYLRHDGRNAHESRKLGYRAATTRYICFLDADDKLSPDYLADAVEIMETDPTIGVVYSDMLHFGDKTDMLVCGNDGRHIERDNYIHAGSVARMAALDASGVMERGLPPDTVEDWVTWRSMLRAGWKAAPNPSLYHYRKHGETRSVKMREVSYYKRAALARENVTIVIPLSGRPVERLANWLNTQTWPKRQISLLLINTTDQNTAQELDLQTSGYQDVRMMRFLVGRSGLADVNRTQHVRDVQRAVAKLYAHIRQHVTTEYVLIVEDDVLPPPAAIHLLMSPMTNNTAAVSGVLWSRYQPSYIAWSGPRQYFTVLGKGVEEIAGAGFGCLLLRRSVWVEGPITCDGQDGDFDPAFFNWVKQRFSVKLHWDVLCQHGELKAAEPWRKRYE